MRRLERSCGDGSTIRDSTADLMNQTPSPTDLITASDVRVVVVCPTYQNADTLGDVLDRIEALGLPALVENDGCQDGTSDLLQARLAQERPVPFHVFDLSQNQGKAAALHRAFDEAQALGYTHAISIDTDGQHDPEDLPKFVAAVHEDPRALVLGWRSEKIEGYPARSRLGRRLSNLAIRLACGLRVRDSQCGLRAYPLGLIQAVKCHSGRYGFESEILTRATWAGCPVREIQITSRYLPLEQRVSHFRPWLDGWHGFWLHWRLLHRELLPIPHRRVWPAAPDSGHEPAVSWWRTFWGWMHPGRVWQDLKRDQIGRFSLAAGLGVGAFIANIPLYGLQTVLCIYVAKRLHLHPLAVVAGSFISTPPLGPVLIVCAVVVGHLILHGSLPDIESFHPDNISLFSMDAMGDLGRVLLEWVVGSFFVGLACMAVVFLVTLGLTSLRRTSADVA